MGPVLTGAHVVVVGAGIAGAACAGELHRAGVRVTVVDRGRAPGGRMASPMVGRRRVDVGAAYFTCSDPAFSDVAERWHEDGLARPWTDRFAVQSGSAPSMTGAGLTRWSAPDGLRSLVRDLLQDQHVRTGVEISAVTFAPAAVTVAGIDADVVVFAMPDPQARRVLARSSISLTIPFVEYAPVLAVTAKWAERCWPFVDGAFVNDHPVLSFVADDGARRGDGAPVLVAHTTAEFAAAHLEDPGAAGEPVVAALAGAFGLPAPTEVLDVHRWSLAKPTGTHDQAFFDSGRFALAGDSWCPSGTPRVESAWLSGTALGRHLAQRLATGSASACPGR